MKTQEFRQKYLDFFKKKQHTIISSASLLPENDPTTLFTGSGMQPMVPYLLGQSHPAGTRIVDSQKCFRSGDIEEVGDNRHTTFFEMLGNWSLGDYFKQEQIAWVFEFLTKEVGLDANKLFVTCYKGNDSINIARDEETATLWQQQFKTVGLDAKIIQNPEEDGMQDGRIFYYDDKKNWWSRSGTPDKMPVGEPGGPDTEMFYDFGIELGLHEKWVNSVSESFPSIREQRKVCHVNCDCGRFTEIGNNVFMQYIKKESGFEELPQKNVDFGGGLERLVAAANGYQDIFMIDIFDNMKHIIDVRSGKTYLESKEITYAYRVILDHLRAATFLIADGAPPSNKDQGYFTRRLVRRAVRFGHTIGIEGHFCGDIVSAVIHSYSNDYDYLLSEKTRILEEVEKEEKKFQKTLKQGLRKLEQLIELKKISGGTQERNRNDFGLKSTDYYNLISGEEAFNIYQSYGFPLEMISEELARSGMGFHEEELKKEFDSERQKHAEQSRKGAEQKFKGGMADHSDMSVKYHTATHLLHAATQKVLGKEAVQKGSNITPERLRFDFAYGEKLTEEQKKQIEDLVNAAITQNYTVGFKLMSVEEAKNTGAIGLFDYGDQVKVYTVGDIDGTPEATAGAKTFSREFCGGPHVGHTGQLGHFSITKEESVGAGVRRIKAILS